VILNTFGIVPISVFMGLLIMKIGVLDAVALMKVLKRGASVRGIGHDPR